MNKILHIWYFNGISYFNNGKRNRFWSTVSCPVLYENNKCYWSQRIVLKTVKNLKILPYTNSIITKIPLNCFSLSILKSAVVVNEQTQLTAMVVKYSHIKNYSIFIKWLCHIFGVVFWLKATHVATRNIFHSTKYFCICTESSFIYSWFGRWTF